MDETIRCTLGGGTDRSFKERVATAVERNRKAAAMGSREDKQTSKGKVLVTGGTGFIATHIINQLLDSGYTVIATVRSQSKGQRLLNSFNLHASHSQLSYVMVEDIITPGAFGQAVQSDPPLDYVIHTASPYFLNPQDPQRDFLDPAMKGTTGLLTSVKEFAPTVKRIVFTSSSAAVLNPEGEKHHDTVYDEDYWAPMTWEKALVPKNAYRASKVFAEKAAWDFVANSKPNFDLAVINNTYTFGPVPRHLPSLDSLNTSNHRIRDMVQGKMKDGLQPTGPVFTFVDVRDVALAHVRAMELPETGGKRFYLVAEHFSNKKIADIIKAEFPQLKKRLPDVESEDDIPQKVYGFDNERSREMLGIEYRSLKTSVVDTVRSILDFDKTGVIG